MFSTISGFYFSCMLLFGMQTRLSIAWLQIYNMRAWTNPPIWHLKRASGNSLPDSPLFHWSVTFFFIIFLFSLVLCANLKLFCPFHGPYIMFDSCTVIAYASLSSWIAVCDAKLPIKLYESQFDKGMYMSTVPLNNKFDVSESSMTLFDSS